ncbi:MAG: fibronectin type III domain-containing protein [Bacteroidales bacterium]|nr:fibronectin type III domain-containing protein [Bacteroidales bacterium]
MDKHVVKLLLILTIVFVPWAAWAQMLGEYTYSTGVDTTKWVDMSSATQIITLTSNGDRVSTVRSIGFRFPFGSATYSQFSVNTDGNLRLGSTATGTGSYTTPFSSANANVNNPKINFFGANGYGTVGSHYVKALQTLDANNDSMLVVEFCTGTYLTATRSNLYKWQVQLHHNGDIEVVYGPAPAAPPSASRQPGLCVNSSDGYYIDGSHREHYFTSGTNLGIASGNWPDYGRYYSFVAPIVSCPRPLSVVANNVGSDSFNIGWNDTSSTASWIVQLLFDNQVIFDSVVTAYPVYVTGLSPATYYTVQVAGICANGDTSSFVATTVLTECATLTRLPYTQNFDQVEGTTNTSVATNNLPPCWMNRNTGTSSLYSGYPIVYRSASYAHSGTNSMRFYTYYTTPTYGDQVAVMPPTDSTLLPLSTLQLSFWMRSHTASYNSHVVVGVMTNPFDLNTFVPVEDVYTNYSTDYEHHLLYFANYHGPHGYIAFKAPQPVTGYNYLYIDDITIESLPSCPPPTHVETANVGPNSADVSWNLVGGASSWLILYVPTGYPIDSAWSALSYDTTATLNDLTANTQYTVMIVANCGSGISDTAFATFRTTCDYITELPFTEDFDSAAGSTNTLVTENNLPPCWMYHNRGTGITSTGYPIVYSSAAEAHSGDNALRFYTYTTEGTYSDQIAILPPTDPLILPLSSLQLSFWMRSTATSYNSYVQVGVMTDPADASTFVPVDTFYTNSSTTYAEYSVLMGRYRGPHGCIAIKAPQPTSTYNALLIDDVTVDYLPPCPSVSDITVTHTTPDSIGIKWYALGSETSWLVSDGTNVYITTDTLFTFGGLAANTQYTLSVRALCPAYGDTSAAMSTTATTQCSYLTSMPFTENFDSHTGVASTSSADNNLPECWAYINPGTRDNYRGYPIIYSNSSYAYSGSNSLRYYAYYNTPDSNHYAILPHTDPTLYPIHALTLSFQMRGHSSEPTYKAEAIVGVMTDPSDARTFVPIDTVDANGSTTYSSYVVHFDQYTGPHGYVALLFRTPRGSSYNYNAGYIDNLVLDVPPDCESVVEVTASNITLNSADISWLDTSVNYSWFVEYGTTGFTPGMGTLLTSYDTSVTITGLMVNTLYDVYVTPNCSGGIAGSTMTTFRTDCGFVDSLPYYESFEGYPIGNSSIAPPYCGVPCYKRLDNATQYHFGYIGNPASYATGAHTGTGFLYYYMPTTLGTYADWIITVLPPINTTLHPLNTLQLSFWVKMNSATSSGDIIVGVMTDPDEDSTFVPVDTVTVVGNVYDLKLSNLSSYVGTGAYIALKYTRNTSTNTYYFVDDILVETTPACPPVTEIALVSSDTSMLSVTWAENGDATAWTVEYGISGFTAGTGITVTATTLPFIITGLTPATAYDIYVTPVCATGSSAARSATFLTADSYIGLPFVCDFENAAQNALWTLDNGTNANKWHISTAANNGGSHSLYVSNDNGTSNAYTVTSSTVDYAYVDVQVASPGDHIISFDWRCQGEGNYDFLRVVLVPHSETLTAGTALPTGLSTASTPASWIALDGGSKLNLQSTWQSYSGVVAVSAAGVYHLAFVFRCDGSGGTTPPPAVDNISFAAFPCPRPDSITLSNLSSSTADLAWSEMGSATEWQYQLDSGSINMVYTTAVALTGLTADTTYTFKVRSVCGGGDTSFWRMYEFSTPCNFITVPYVQDFEGEAISSSSTGSVFAGCWNRINNGTSSGGYPYVGGSTYNHTAGGAKGLYWYNSTTAGSYGDYMCAVLPPVDTAISISSLQLSFWGKSSSATASPLLQVGVMTDPNNLATFVGVDTFNVSGTSWREIQVPLSTYAGNGRYVAIKADRAGNSWGVYTDDFILDYAPTCIVPRNVVAIHATTYSLTVDWTDVTPATEWQVEYGPQGFVRGSSAGTLMTVYSHPITVTGLDTLSNYDFYIRPVCTVGDTAGWRNEPSATLNTAICDNAEDFTIGSPSSGGVTYFAPVNNYYKYTFSEVIIESSEIGGTMNIEYIGYYYDYGTAMTDKTNCTIYFQPTTKSTFSSSSDVEALDTTSAVMVYTGPLNCSRGWNYFPLDTVYYFDASTNLMVIVDDNSGDYNSTSYVFRSEPCSGNKVLYYYSDSQNPDPFIISSAYTGTKAVNSWRPVMQLLSCSAPYCPRPVIASLSQTHESVTVSWTGDSNNYEVNIKESAAIDWSATDIAVTGHTYTFTGLQPSTSYSVRVRQDCNGIGYSEWVVDTVITDMLPCLPPDSLTTFGITNATATFDWVPFGLETLWDVHVWNTAGFDTIYTVSTHPVILGGYIPGVTYNASVRPLCGDANNIIGGWSDTLSFTTATCPDVMNLTAGEIGVNSLTLTWSADPAAVSWVVEYGYTGFEHGSGIQAVVTMSSYVVTGLQEETSYDFYVRTMCDTGWYSENWTYIAATTLYGGVECDEPTGVNAVVAGNAATVSWTAGAGNTSYELEYGPHGFAHGTGMTQTATTAPVTITNLNYETQYDVYVRAFCEQNASSAWSIVTSFTTEAQGSEDCDPVTNLTATEITENSAVVSWTAGATGDEWEVVLTDAGGTMLSETRTHEQRYQLNGLTPGTSYIVKVRTVCGDDQYSDYASTSFTTIAVGIDRVTEATCTIYPNPTSSATTISVSGVSGKVKIAVVDMNGRTVASELLECSSDCTKTMNVERLAQGAYFVRITGENVNMVKKLIVR